MNNIVDKYQHAFTFAMKDKEGFIKEYSALEDTQEAYDYFKLPSYCRRVILLDSLKECCGTSSYFGFGLKNILPPA